MSGYGMTSRPVRELAEDAAQHASYTGRSVASAFRAVAATTISDPPAREGRCIGDPLGLSRQSIRALEDAR